MTLGDIENSSDYYFSSLKIAKKFNFDSCIAINLIGIAKIERDNGKFDQSINNLQSALEIYNKQNYLLGQADCYNLFGSINYYASNYQNSIYNLKKSIEINKKIKNKLGLSSNYQNIAIAYYNLKNYELAIDYYHQSEKLIKELKLFNNLSSLYNNLGLLYRDIGNLQKAFKFLSEAIEIAKATNNIRMLASSQLNLGLLFIDKNNNKAKKIISNSINNFRNLQNILGEANAIYSLGVVYEKEGKLEEALDLMKESLEKFKKINNSKKVELVEKNIYLLEEKKQITIKK